jgi:uroporphyrinogen decarboxylase
MEEVMAGPVPAAATPKRLLATLRGQHVPGPPPVWLMRQAGRYLPEYRAVRAEAGSFLDLCYDTARATEVTLQPVRRFALDGAILFSDILVVPDGLGADVRFVEGEGPRLEPLRDDAGLRRLDPTRLRRHLAPVYATVARLRAELPERLTLLGFAGAPWTLAAYLIEGQGSREFAVARTLARENAGLVAALVDLLTEATIDHLDAQIAAGADAVQLFDSWAGVLPPEERARWCVAPARRIVTALAERWPATPVVLFPRGVGAGYLELADLGAAALSLDTTVPMAWAARQLGPPGLALQGNLDPLALLGPEPELLAEAGRIVAAAAGRPHVFNLGHGVVPQTPPARVAALVDHLQSLATRATF